MKWRGRRRSTNVRAKSGGGRVAGGGIFGIIIGLVLWLVFGVNPMTAFQTGSTMAGGGTTNTTAAPASNTSDDRDTYFLQVVLADTEDVWSQVFQENGRTYQPVTLQPFDGRVSTQGCGGATAATGPFYCPTDKTIYIDTSFFTEMRQNLGITGDVQGSGDSENQGRAGDFAQAYVIAHEVGHHIQTLLGTSQKVNQARRQVSEAQGNQLSVRLELQADCYAGVWANRNQQRVQFLDEGDIEEALNAASHIGDDRLAKAGGRVAVPDNFTHGTSQQRVDWFTRGLQTGDIANCETFTGRI